MNKIDADDFADSADMRGVALALDLLIDIEDEEEKDSAAIREVIYRAKALELGPEVDRAFRETLRDTWLGPK